MILLYRAPLLLGMLLLQVTPTAQTPPSSFTDLLLQALPQVPIYVILAYIVINMQRDNAKSDERRDKHEDQLTTALVVERQRIDDIEDDRRARAESQEKKENERDAKYIESFQALSDASNRTADILELMQKGDAARDRVTSDAVSAITTLVTVGSKPLQQVVVNVGSIKDKTEEIHTVVSAIFDRFLKVFPTESDMEKRITELEHAIIQSVATVSEQKKHDTGEIAPILPTQIELTVITPPDLAKASGE
jgi:hypothetical protein